jgi:hypothetical protein
MGHAPINRELRMTIGEIVRQGLHYARTCRSLWLFGFFVGIANGGSNGGSGAGGHGSGAAGAGLDFSATPIALVAIVVILAAAAAFVMRFVGEGALIEGVVRARQGGAMTTREGFRAGWAHWGVLARIALLYLAAFLGSLAALMAMCVITWQALGGFATVLFGIPALVIAVPWLVTIYLVQAFAARIAVLEHRQALDAIGKARLFLHGRLFHGLKLMAATFLGSLGIAFLSVVAIAPVALLLVALIPVLRVFPVIVLACLVLLPLAGVLIAMLGTYRSSVWTIGYVTQVGS